MNKKDEEKRDKLIDAIASNYFDLRTASSFGEMGDYYKLKGKIWEQVKELSYLVSDGILD